MQNFLSVFLALFPAVDWIYFPIMNSVGRFVYSHVHVFKNVAGVFAQLFVAGLLNILIAIWMTGKPAWYTLRRSLRLPETKGLALAVAFPIVISALISVGQFLLVLFLWSADKSGRLGPPHIGPYFTLPGTESLLLLFFALTEEIIFRGILQPRFIRRYGLLRGLFLVGVVFAAAHLNGDFSGSFTDGLVIFRLFVRLSGALPLSFVAGWLTLRSGSVFPAAVAHGLMNVLGNSPLGPTFWGIGLVMDLLWAILAYFLFRYWPVRAEPDERLCAAIATPAGFD
jgi:membrane protease YdiL (CAAX protease family)